MNLYDISLNFRKRVAEATNDDGVIDEEAIKQASILAEKDLLALGKIIDEMEAEKNAVEEVRRRNTQKIKTLSHNIDRLKFMLGDQMCELGIKSVKDPEIKVSLSCSQTVKWKPLTTEDMSIIRMAHPEAIRVKETCEINKDFMNKKIKAENWNIPDDLKDFCEVGTSYRITIK